jgi:hypothetical protein
MTDSFQMRTRTFSGPRWQSLYKRGEQAYMMHIRCIALSGCQMVGAHD